MWAVYLWTAKVVVDGTSGTFSCFGRARPSVDLSSLDYVDVGIEISVPFFSPELNIRDTAGHGFGLQEMYWKGWKDFRAIVEPNPVHKLPFGYTKRLSEGKGKHGRT